MEIISLITVAVFDIGAYDDIQVLMARYGYVYADRGTPQQTQTHASLACIFEARGERFKKNEMLIQLLCEVQLYLVQLVFYRQRCCIGVLRLFF